MLMYAYCKLRNVSFNLEHINREIWIPDSFSFFLCFHMSNPETILIRSHEIVKLWNFDAEKLIHSEKYNFAPSSVIILYMDSGNIY